MIDISKVAFVFFIFTIIAGGESLTLLSCQMQKNLKNNIFLKHLIGYLLIFGMIMMEGGWEFNYDTTTYSTDWTNGNTLHSLGWAVILYLLLILSSKMKFLFSLILVILIFIIYIINTYKNNLILKKEIDDKRENIYKNITNILILLFLLTLIIGFFEYLIYKKKEYAKNFDFIKFFIGVNKCKKL
tara:strand:- start:4982 stop:5539 length:558 start_codon:yes stop_codon:yes gene_type:complete